MTPTPPMVTLINIYQCQAPQQDALVALLHEINGEVSRHREGFVSAKVLVGKDGTSAAVIAQWQSEDHWRALMRDIRINSLMEQVMKIATFAPRLYQETKSFLPEVL